MDGKHKSDRLEKWLPAVLAALLAAYFAAFCIINFIGFERFCTGDMYEDTYVARLMWEQKTLFPDGWVFGNQFYVFATPVLAAPFYGLTGSMNLAMALATTVMTFLMLGAFCWMLRPFARPRELILGATLLVSAVMGPNLYNDIEPQIFYIFASYYAGYAITLFMVFGDYLRVSAGKRSALPSVSFAIALILSFCTGMHSLRQTAVMAVPLLALEGLRWLARVIRTRKPAESLSPRPLLHVLSVTAANLLGCAAIRLIAPAQVTIYGEMELLSLSKLGEHLSTALRALRSITGLKYLLTDRFIPFLGLFAAALVLIVLLALGQTLLSRREEDGHLALCAWLCVLSILATEASSLVLDISLRSIYLFAWYPLAAVCGVLLARRFPRPHWQVVLALLMAANLCVTYLPSVRQSLTRPQSITAETAQWLEDSGYTILYGPWATACEVAAYTDGAVVAGAWTDTDLTILGYINPQNIYSAEDNAKAVYLVTAEQREAVLAYAAAHGAEFQPVASFRDGAWQLYTSSVPLLHP